MADTTLGVNEFGTPVSIHTCRACGHEFTLCPPDEQGAFGSDCTGDTCPSYDPRRDVGLLMDAGVEIRPAQSGDTQ